MKEQKDKKLIEKTSGISIETFGETLYFRPFAEDDEIIRKIVAATREKRSTVAQKLLHLAIRENQFDFDSGNKQLAKLDWLVNQEKFRALKDEVREQQMERLEEHAHEMESRLAALNEHTHLARILTSEIYCLAVVCMSYLNLIFTKIIEYFSPVEMEKKNSADFANRSALGLIEHSLRELGNLENHHNSNGSDPDLLYLFTKIEILKQRLVPLDGAKNKGQK